MVRALRKSFVHHHLEGILGVFLFIPFILLFAVILIISFLIVCVNPKNWKDES